MPNRLADTPRGVYYALPYYAQATGPRRDVADFTGPDNEAFIRTTSTMSDIPHGFIDDKWRGDSGHGQSLLYQGPFELSLAE